MSDVFSTRLRATLLLLLLLTVVAVGGIWLTLDKVSTIRQSQSEKSVQQNTSQELKPEPGPAQPYMLGTLATIQGYKVLTLEGTPEEMGRDAGLLIGETVRRVVKQLIADDIGKDPAAYRNLLQGSAIMEKFQPPEYCAELKALAKAVDVKYEDLLLLQYHGDVRRGITGPGSGTMCTSFAVLPPNTKEKVCLVGRNLDYFDNGVSEYAALLIYYKPQGKIPFLTVTWAGIINGWTLLSEKGIFVSNNTAFGVKEESLNGISTCFLLRKIAEEATSIKEGIEIARKGPRACGTNLLIAQGDPPDAVILEFDHKGFAIRRPVNGFVGAANSFVKLYQSNPQDGPSRYGRCGQAWDVVREHKGQVDFDLNIAGAEGVPIPSMNLHCATIDVTRRRIRVAMGGIPAYKLPFKTFQLTESGIENVPLEKALNRR